MELGKRELKQTWCTKRIQILLILGKVIYSQSLHLHLTGLIAYHSREWDKRKGVNVRLLRIDLASVRPQDGVLLITSSHFGNWKGNLLTLVREFAFNGNKKASKIKNIWAKRKEYCIIYESLFHVKINCKMHLNFDRFVRLVADVKYWFFQTQIRLNGEPISESAFSSYFWSVYNKLCDEKYADRPAYFKFLTIMAFNIFWKEKVDVAIIEGTTQEMTVPYMRPLIRF